MCFQFNLDIAFEAKKKKQISFKMHTQQFAKKEDMSYHCAVYIEGYIHSLFLIKREKPFHFDCAAKDWHLLGHKVNLL